jgi:hypothetical protein
MAPRESAKAAIDRALQRVLRQAGGRSGWKFEVFVRRIQAQSDLLRPGWLAGRVETSWIERLATGLLSLYGCRRSWLRQVESWEPPASGTGPIGVFASLAHHLVARYRVPPVLLSAWYVDREGWRGCTYQRWFQQAGQGRPLRELGLPVAMTRRMAHLFATASADLSISDALRWAQVRGMGGSEGLARALIATRLGGHVEHEREWAEAIRRLVALEPLDLKIIPDFVAYYHERKLDLREVVIGDDDEGAEAYLPAPEPELSITGWSAASLKRRVEDWKEQRARTDGKPERVRITWAGLAGVEPLKEVDEAGRLWTIVELTDSDALAAEGKAMHNCVATYLQSCTASRSSIWSLGVEEPDGRPRRSVATIEVIPETRRIEQAKAACNEPPDEETRARLNRWTSREGLQLNWEEL